MLTEGEFGQHDWQVDIVRPVEDARAVRERERVAGEGGPRADQRHLQMQTRLAVAVEEEPLFLAVRLVENDETPGSPWWIDFG